MNFDYQENFNAKLASTDYRYASIDVLIFCAAVPRFACAFHFAWGANAAIDFYPITRVKLGGRNFMHHDIKNFANMNISFTAKPFWFIVVGIHVVRTLVFVEVVGRFSFGADDFR